MTQKGKGAREGKSTKNIISKRGRKGRWKAKNPSQVTTRQKRK